MGFIKLNKEGQVLETQEEEKSKGYVWVGGYKGTDANMQCKNDFQYELGKEYVCEGEPKICENGFHLSLFLKDVCDYVAFTEPSNRYFKVRALVDRTALEDYHNSHLSMSIYKLPITKLVAKKIVLTEEVSNETFYNTMIKDNREYRYVRSLEDYEAFKNQDKEWTEFFFYKEIERLNGKYTSQFIELCVRGQNFSKIIKFIDIAESLYNENVTSDVRIPWLLKYMNV